jgi:hypothetical protein
MSTVASFDLRDSRVAQVLRDVLAGSRPLAVNALVMLLCFLVCSVLQVIDHREFNGANVWMKPAKFFFSLAVHFATIGWALSYATDEIKQSRLVTWTSRAMIVSAWYELLYISFRAARGEASHFNIGTLANAVLYDLMALGAVVLVVGAALIGWVIWRRGPRSLWTDAIALGFGLGAVLALVVGFTLGGNSGHWIGGDMTDATGLPIFKWSTTGGDLRVSHFIGLHAMQLVPFAAMNGRRSVVYGVSLAITVLTVLTYVQAMMGVPLFQP